MPKNPPNVAKERLQKLLQDHAEEAGRGWQLEMARKLSRTEGDVGKIQTMISRAYTNAQGGIEAFILAMKFFHIDPDYFWAPGNPDIRRYKLRPVPPPPLGKTPALLQFLQSIEGQTVTKQEQKILTDAILPGLDGEVTILTYHYLLNAIRSVKQGEKDANDDIETDVRRKE